MLTAVKISELPLHPQATNPSFVDLDHILPILGRDGAGWTTYQTPVSSIVPAISLSADATAIASTDPADVTITQVGARNSYKLDFHIPQGRVPALTGGSVTMLHTSAISDARVFFDVPFPARPGVDYTVSFALPRGPKGEQGDQGIGINFKGFKETKAELIELNTSTPSPCLGDAWFVKADESVITTIPQASSDVFYIWSLSGNPAFPTWVAGGSGLKGPKGEKGDQGDFVNFSVSAINVNPGQPATIGISPDPAFPSFPNLYKRMTIGVPQGLSGLSPTVQVRNVATLPAGTSATVTNAGTQLSAVFDFGIPQGFTPTVTISTVTLLSGGSVPYVTNTGTPTAAAFNFGIPAGITPSITINPVVSALSAGATPIVTNTGVPSAAYFNFGIPMGRTPTVLVGSVSALSAGSTPIVTTTTSTDNLSSTLSFGIPIGRAATIALATPPAVSATFTAPPSVVNTGSLSAAVFQFVIPQGAPGDWTAPQAINNITGGTTYTLVTSDIGKILLMNHGGGTTITVPTGFPVGTKVDVIRMTTGAVSFVAGAGATVNFTPSGALRAQYSSASVICTTANNYVVVGDLA